MVGWSYDWYPRREEFRCPAKCQGIVKSSGRNIQNNKLVEKRELGYSSSPWWMLRYAVSRHNDETSPHAATARHPRRWQQKRSAMPNWGRPCMASQLVKAVLGDGTFTSLPRIKVKIQHFASVLNGLTHFSTMTCHDLVIPLSECRKIRRPSPGMPWLM